MSVCQECVDTDGYVSACVNCTTCSELRSLLFITRLLFVIYCVPVNETSPTQIPVYILMSLANKIPSVYLCVLVRGDSPGLFLSLCVVVGFLSSLCMTLIVGLLLFVSLRDPAGLTSSTLYDAVSPSSFLHRGHRPTTSTPWRFAPP